MQSHYREWERSLVVNSSHQTFGGRLTASPLCGQSSPRLPLCATPDCEAFPPSSSWKCSFFPLPFEKMSFQLCLLLWSVTVSYSDAGCDWDKEMPRCHALAAAAGVPVMKWLGWCCWWWWSGLPCQRADGGGTVTKCSWAHCSDKMAGRKAEGCQKERKIKEMSKK